MFDLGFTDGEKGLTSFLTHMSETVKSLDTEELMDFLLLIEHIKKSEEWESEVVDGDKKLVESICSDLAQYRKLDNIVYGYLFALGYGKEIAMNIYFTQYIKTKGAKCHKCHKSLIWESLDKAFRDTPACHFMSEEEIINEVKKFTKSIHEDENRKYQVLARLTAFANMMRNMIKKSTLENAPKLS